jgi:glutamate N-acetyltransferase / amino-acid N-acetyltransferase
VRWPRGVKSSGVACGIKPAGASDLGLLRTELPVEWAGTFTRNAAAAAPVTWSRARLGHPVRALVVNSGNANACTGPSGHAAVENTAEAAASVVGCRAEEVLVSSTGPIGVPLPVERIVRYLPEAAATLSDDTADFATSILTTDTRSKVACQQLEGASITGVAKGAAMLAPNMATMLAFIGTDAIVPEDHLQSSLTSAVRASFDRISVDACESTNDSVYLLSTGLGARVEAGRFDAALGEVCSGLAEQMVRDAEGASKLVRIEVLGAADEDHGVTLGRAVAASCLWRAAVNGEDPNWGRVISALGAIDRSLNPEALDLWIGAQQVFRAGAPVGGSDGWDKAAAEMRADEVRISCVVGPGSAHVEVLSADLSAGYVELNAGGTT